MSGAGAQQQFSISNHHVVHLASTAGIPSESCLVFALNSINPVSLAAELICRLCYLVAICSILRILG